MSGVILEIDAERGLWDYYEKILGNFFKYIKREIQ